MDRWLDSLSEDWPSQPPSQHNSSSLLQEDSTHKINGNQSRLPRRRGSGFSSLSSVKAKEVGLGPAAYQNHTGDGPLKERTKSSLNAAGRHLDDNKAKSPSSDAVQKQVKTHNTSTSSTPSAPMGTVAYKVSPTKQAGGTPEWKRRVVQGKVGQGDHTDMFGPIGLESVFRPPPTSTKPTKGGKHAGSGFQMLLERPSHPLDRMPCGPALGSNKSSGRLSMDGDAVEINRVKETAFTNSNERANESAYNVGEHGRSQRSPTRSSTASISKPTKTPVSDSQNDSHLEHSGSNSFSPFVVSKSHTMDGKVDYAAIDHGKKHSEDRSSRLERREPPFSYQGNSVLSFRKSQMNEITSQSLPEDLSVGTDAYAANGGFVSIRRGGYSNEGSFKERSLSPSPVKYIGGQDDQSLNYSNLRLPSPNSKMSPSHDASPPVTPEKDDDERPRSSGSPLKLFDKYDTFTNNRLARHISRFEETLAQNETPEAILGDDPQPSSPSPGPKISMKLSRMNEPENDLRIRRVKSFGSGELDDIDFSANGDGNAELSLPYHAHVISSERHFLDHKRGRKVSRRSRRVESSDQSFSLQISDNEDTRLLNEENNALQLPKNSEITYTLNGKRHPESPQKNTARKRRKTLCSSEERKREALDARRPDPLSLVKETSIQVANGRKRKDARYGTEKQAADPKTLAMRQILRPRNPTPNQTGSSARQKPSASLEHLHSASTRDHSVNSSHAPTGSAANIDPPTQIVAGALATIALNTVQEMETGSRKVSVTTSDFFNEAQQIMALIRAERRPRSSHTSAETSNTGPSIIHEEVSTADSTKEDLTRPPSREGGTLRNLQLPTERDARLVSHLRKFEDKDELGLTLPSSGQSLKISHCDIAFLASPVKLNEEDQFDNVESDPPNTRIQVGLGDNQQRGHPSLKSKDTENQIDTAAGKIDSHSSYGSSSRKSVPTRSSQGSANIKKIAPQSVAHLLTDQMADMFFDKQRQMWVKRKLSTAKDQSHGEAPAGSEGTEEDLFGGIPDLTIDEMEELKMVKHVVSTGNTLGSTRSTTSMPHQAVESVGRGIESASSNQDARPRTADGKIIHPTENSSAPSKHTNFAWSGPIPGTRATSYGDEVWDDKRTHEHQANEPDETEALSSPEVEHEISIFQGRVDPNAARSRTKGYQPRVVTVAFSSPLIQSPHQPEEDWEGTDQSKLEDSPTRPTLQTQVSTKRQIFSNTSRYQRRFSHRLSVGNSSIIARPMSRLDEQDELSLIHYSARHPHTSTDLAVMTPLPTARQWIGPPQSSVGFELSPLPDFTVHQVDRPLDAEHSIDFGRSQVRQVSTALSITAQEILKHLTDLEPFEPYWYYMQKVVLQDRSLTSLHMLEDFCGQIQDLDVSKNGIRELDGVPSTVRSLNIRENCLSELTSWHSLLHLQYLDVSGNQVRSLKGFQDLIHLRSLTADNNQIESLDGLECLDGLLSLRLRNNRLSLVSFERLNLKRLSKLDLRGNNLTEVAQLSCLESLQTLNLSLNSIRDLCLSAPMPKLWTLDVADNQLDRIDITSAPNLKTLITDRNAVCQINGLRTHPRLENLLWREQSVTTSLVAQVEVCREIRNLYLSSTCPSPALNFKPSFLNLNILEMASMGLQSLPEEFGVMCKNLRSLNLNYNAIHDIRPLLGITRLRNLYLAGNRLSRLRRTAAVIHRLSPELAELDMRNNTLTVGFYTPQTLSSSGTRERRLVVHNSGSSVSSSVDDESDYIAESTKAHLLPALDKDADTASRERLDEDTKLRRRVYEMLLVSACKSLQRLDGLDVDRSAVARRDGVWERLVELDVLKPRVA